MNVLADKSIYGSINDDHFAFAMKVIEQFEALPTKQKVVFPLPNRSSQFADVACKIGYNGDHKPFVEFSFFIEREELAMAHTAIVTTTVTNGSLQLELTIKPNRRLRDTGHRSLSRVYNTAKEVAMAIAQNYTIGSPGRKVVVVPANRKAA